VKERVDTSSRPKIALTKLFMDIVYFPKETPLIQKARDVGCGVIYGEEMFLNQALAQAEIWQTEIWHLQ